MGYFLTGLVEQLLIGVAEHLAQRAVDLQEASALGLVQRHADGCVIERAAESFLGLPQFLFGILALGDVYEDALPVERFALFVPDKVRLIPYPDRVAVARDHTVL